MTSTFSPAFSSPLGSIPIIELTPQKAHELLALNTQNRRVNKYHLDEYVRAILAGDWHNVGDPIRVSNTGKLLDGQHRCLAVIVANKSILVPFMDDLQESMQGVMDVGKIRTVGDHLEILNVSGASLHAAVLRNLFVLATKNTTTKMAIPVADRILAAHPEISSSVKRVGQVDFVPPAMVAAVHYIGAVIQKKKAQADDFVDVLKLGTPNYQNDPAHALREKFIRVKTKKMTVHHTTKLFTIVYAWQQFAKNKKLTNIIWKDPYDIAGWSEGDLEKNP